jgi:hypothetical protein
LALIDGPLNGEPGKETYPPPAFKLYSINKSEKGGTGGTIEY